MKKEEFPTFLNEQPTIIFGRTGRELMIIAAGLSVDGVIWGKAGSLFNTAGGAIAVITLMVVVAIASVVIALLSVAGRPLEEWIFVLLYYIGMPKLFLYAPLEEENMQQEEKKHAATVKKTRTVAVAVADPYDDDPSDS